MKSHIPNIGVNLFIYLKKPILLVRRIYQPKNLNIIFKIVILAVYVSRSTHTTEFRTHARKPVASYRQMKYLESNLVCVNAVSVPDSNQHDIAYQISEKIA